MAERVAAIPPRKDNQGGRYQWDEWLDGSVWELIQGKDFDVAAANFAATVRQKAERSHLKVTIAIRGDRVYVQAQREER